MLDTFSLCYNAVLNRLRSTTTDADYTALAKTFVNQRHKETLAWKLWPFLQETGTVNLLTPYSTGTISGTQGSTTVTGSGTTFTSNHTGWLLLPFGGKEFYTVTYVSATQLTVSPAISTSSFSGVTFYLFQHRYAIPADFRMGSEGVNYITDPPLEFAGIREINREMTNLYFDYPRLWSLDFNGTTTPNLVFYPISNNYAQIRFNYYRSVSDLSADADPILIPDPYRRLIIEGALSDFSDIDESGNQAVQQVSKYEQNYLTIRNRMAADYGLLDDEPALTPYSLRKKKVFFRYDDDLDSDVIERQRYNPPALIYNNVVLISPGGIAYQLIVSNGGILSVAYYYGFILDIITVLKSSGGFYWNLQITDLGVLSTNSITLAQMTAIGAMAKTVQLISPSGLKWSLLVTDAGVLQTSN